MQSGTSLNFFYRSDRNATGNTHSHIHSDALLPPPPLERRCLGEDREEKGTTEREKTQFSPATSRLSVTPTSHLGLLICEAEKSQECWFLCVRTQTWLLKGNANPTPNEEARLRPHTPPQQLQSELGQAREASGSLRLSKV